MHAPSPITKPALVASNGRIASVGSTSSATSPRIAQKPARISGVIAASVPPARTTSACPRLIVAAASPIAVEPVAHAETGAKFGPVIPSWIAIWPLAVSTSADGMKKGETRSAPRSRKTRCCSTIVAIPPIAEPTRIATRAGSNRSIPASVHASWAAATANRTLRSMRRASFAGRWASGSKPRTSPAIRTGNELASNASMKPMPLRPATAASQVEGASRPIGVTAPSPVITTRRMKRRA